MQALFKRANTTGELHKRVIESRLNPLTAPSDTFDLATEILTHMEKDMRKT